MDPRLLRLYNEELAHLREVGGEFAREFPKIARRLSMDGLEVADPYVERLLEGFAFMAARIQLKLDAEYPQFIAHLLECVLPNFLAPVPSMMVARLHPDFANPGLARGASVPRGTAVTSQTPRGQNTRCEFRTAHDVRLWPLELTQVQYFAHAGDLPLAQLPVARQVRGGLRLRLKAHGGLSLSQLPLESLEFHVSAGGETGYRLHELIGSAAIGTLVWPLGAAAAPLPPAAVQFRESVSSVRLAGHSEREALLPETLRGFSAYRLLQEFAAMPQRFLFFELHQLADRIARLSVSEVDVVVLFSRAEPTLEALIDTSSVALYCTPAINLFAKRLDRITVDSSAHEFHAVPDRTRPMDFEVHGIESVTGYGTGPVSTQAFVPMYAAFHDEPAEQPGYFSMKRVPRLLSQRQTQQGARSAYVGSEVFLSLVQPDGEPYREDLRQLAVSAWVTNRDLPILLGGTPNGEPNQNQTAWALDGVGTVQTVECLRGPTRPLSRQAWGAHGWSLINHLTLNYLSIAGEDPQRAAAALRNLLALYGPEGEPTWRKQVEGVIAVRAHAVTRRLPQGGPLTFGSGVQVEVEIDELGFQGASAHLLGSVLDHVFARQAAINTFCETVVRSTTRGVIGHWPPRVGEQALLSP
jgi:type VI secretion system protein ImpG